MLRKLFENARSAIDFLEHHQVEPSVRHYEIALSYCANPYSSLAKEIDAATEDGFRLTSSVLAQLTEKYFSDKRDVVLKSREQQVVRQSDQLYTLTSDAHDLTSSLEHDVETIVAKSNDWPNDASEFITRLSNAERELSELRREFATLHGQIGSSDHAQINYDRDEMTQALNKDGAKIFLDETSRSSKSYVIILLSIDDLESFNARYGRQVGNNILNAFASTLRTAFANHELIRWSPNEFIIAMKDATLINAQIATDEALTAMKSRRLKLRGTGEGIGIVTASAGISLGHGSAWQPVVERARSLAANAYANGGNSYES